jgi:hypothetical protein
MTLSSISFAGSPNHPHKRESPSAERNKGPLWDIVLSKYFDHHLRNINHNHNNTHNNLTVLEIAAGSGVHAHYFGPQFIQQYYGGNATTTTTTTVPTTTTTVLWQCTDPDLSSLTSQEAYLTEITIPSTTSTTSTTVQEQPTEEDSSPSSEILRPWRTIPTTTSSDSSDSSSSGSTITVHYAKPVQLTLQEEGICEVSTQRAIVTSSSSHTVDWIWNINMIHITPWSATQGLMKTARQVLQHEGYLFLYGPFRVHGTMVESNV